MATKSKPLSEDVIELAAELMFLTADLTSDKALKMAVRISSSPGNVLLFQRFITRYYLQDNSVNNVHNLKLIYNLYFST